MTERIRCTACDKPLGAADVTEGSERAVWIDGGEISFSSWEVGATVRLWCSACAATGGEGTEADR